MTYKESVGDVRGQSSGTHREWAWTGRGDVAQTKTSEWELLREEFTSPRGQLSNSGVGQSPHAHHQTFFLLFLGTQLDHVSLQVDVVK